MNLPEDYKQYMLEQLRRVVAANPHQFAGVGVYLWYIPGEGKATFEFNANLESGLCERASDLEFAVDRLLRVGTFETVKL